MKKMLFIVTVVVLMITAIFPIRLGVLRFEE